MNIKLFGINFKISFVNLAAMVFLMLIFEKTTSFVGFLVFFCIILHEFGHILAMRKLGGWPREIQIGFFDIKIVDENTYSKDFISDIIIFLAGPMANILLGFIFSIAYIFFADKSLLELYLINIFLGIFNLMPISPLDGGQILFSLLSLKFESKKCELFLYISSSIAIIFLLIVSFFISIKINNFLFLFLMVYLVVMIFKK